MVDLYTDINVTIMNIAQGSFSSKLNIFMILLIAFGFLHENIQSGLDLYRTEKKILLERFGGRKLNEEDWKNASVKKNSKNGGLKQSLRTYFWPYNQLNVFSLATLYNILTLFSLRCIVDRLRIAIHRPMSIQEYRRRNVNRYRLLEFNVIIERIPQFLIQLYTFHILMNNLTKSIPNPLDSAQCSQHFNYSRFTEDYNSTAEFFGKDVRYGQIYLRVFSLMTTMIMVISGPVNMEFAMRRLDPFVSFSLGLKCLYGIAAFLMINGRFMVIPAIMHSFENMPVFFGYMIANALLRFVINVLRCNKCIKKSSQVWHLLLISFRDFFWISLRKPEAYIINPTKVRYHTLWSKPELAGRAIFHLLEGIFCAAYVDSHYPCGRYSHIFRLTGWLGLSMYQLSFSLLLPLADWLHPEKTLPGQSNLDKSKAALMIICNITVSSLLYCIFHVSKAGNERLLIVIGIPNIFIILLPVMLLIRLFLKMTRRWFAMCIFKYSRIPANPNS